MTRVDCISIRLVPTRVHAYIHDDVLFVSLFGSFVLWRENAISLVINTSKHKQQNHNPDLNCTCLTNLDLKQGQECSPEGKNCKNAFQREFLLIMNH